MMKAFITQLFFGCTLIFAAPVVRAESPETKTSAIDARLDLQTFRQTSIGSKLVAFAKSKAEASIKDATKGEGGWQNVIDAAGFDPLEEIQSITAISNGFENIKDDMLVVVQMKSTTGNLEGLVVAAPGYTSTEYQGQTIHTAEFDHENRVSAAIIEGPSKQIAIATNTALLKSFMDSTDSSHQELLQGNHHEGAFLEVNVRAFPEELIKEGPPANFAKLVDHMSLSLAESESEMHVQLTLHTHTPEQSEQIRQMVEGLRAMVDLFKNEIHDEDAKKAADIVKTLTVKKEDSSVTVSTSLPSDLLLNFLRNDAGLSL